MKPKRPPTIDHQQKLAEITLKTKEGRKIIADIEAEKARVQVLKINCLRELLTSVTILEDTSPTKDFPTFLPGFDLADQDRIRAKIFQIMDQM